MVVIAGAANEGDVVEDSGGTHSIALCWEAYHMWGVASLCPSVFDRQSISGEPGGYLAGYTPVWPGNLRPARSEPCSFADGGH